MSNTITPIQPVETPQRSRLANATSSQILSSATNLIGGLFVLRLSDSIEQFADYALALTFYLLALSVYRALVAEPLLALKTDHVPAADAAKATWLTGAFAAGMLLAAAAVPGNLLVPDPVWLGLAVVLPGVIAQDHVRQLSFLAGNFKATISDAVWLGLICVAWATVAVFELSVSAAGALLIWGVAGSLAAGVALGSLIAGVRGSGREWLASSGRSGPKYVFEFVVERMSFQVSLIAFAAVAGVAAFGSWRVAALVLGPLTVIHGGAFSFLVPYLSKFSERHEAFVRKEFVHKAVLSILCVVLVDLAVIGSVALAPASLLGLVTGGDAVPSRWLLVLVGGYTITWGVSAVGRAAHRASPALRGSLQIRLTTGALAFAALAPLIVWRSAEAYSLGLLVTGLATTALWVFSVLRSDGEIIVLDGPEVA